MHEIEPHYNWSHLYNSAEDPRSPFFGREYSEFLYHNRVYNHAIHPQWDEFGSETLYLKILFVHYEKHYAIIEMIGEWNDCIHNDIMTLKREVIDPFLEEKINRFIIIGENVLNFHASDDSYYEEWFQDAGEEGWISFINFRPHVLKEFSDYQVDYFVNYGGDLDGMDWRPMSPGLVFKMVGKTLTKRLV